ncbi:MAG: hypothetical protein ACFFC7_04770 [Candidatus Hermodarchaeota archaeon]
MASIVPLLVALGVSLALIIITFLVYLRFKYQNQQLRFDAQLSSQILTFWGPIIVMAIFAIVVDILTGSFLNSIKPTTPVQTLEITYWVSARALVDLGIKFIPILLILALTQLVTDRLSLFERAFSVGLGAGFGALLSKSILAAISAVGDPSAIDIASSSIDSGMLLFIHGALAVMMVYGLKIASEGNELASFLSITFIISLVFAFVLTAVIYIGDLLVEFQLVPGIVTTFWLVLWWVLFGIVFFIMRFIFNRVFHLDSEVAS